MDKTDADLELKIDMAALRLQCAKNQEERRAAWQELSTLSKQRSAKRVTEMERQQGLLR